VHVPSVNTANEDAMTKNCGIVLKSAKEVCSEFHSNRWIDADTWWIANHNFSSFGDNNYCMCRL